VEEVEEEGRESGRIGGIGDGRLRWTKKVSQYRMSDLRVPFLESIDLFISLHTMHCLTQQAPLALHESWQKDLDATPLCNEYTRLAYGPAKMVSSKGNNGESEGLWLASNALEAVQIT
jgi:hypothetical protein